MIPRSRPVMIVLAVIAAAQAFLASAGLADWLTQQQIGIANALVAALSVGMSVYLSGTNVEGSKVAVAMSGPSTAVAGPASPLPTGEVLSARETIEDVTPPPPSEKG